MTPSHTEHGSGFADGVARTAERAIQSTQRGAGETFESLGGAVEERRRKADAMLDQAADQVGSLADQGTDAIRATAHAMRERAQHASDATLDYIRNEPLKAVLIAAAAGAVLMAFISLMRQSRH